MEFSEQMRTAFGGLDAGSDVRHDCHTCRQYSLCRYTRIRLIYFTLTEFFNSYSNHCHSRWNALAGTELCTGTGFIMYFQPETNYNVCKYVS